MRASDPTSPYAQVNWSDPAVVDHLVQKSVKPLLIGTFLSCILLGIIFSLTWRYFAVFHRTDRLIFQLLVAVCFALAVLDTVFDCMWAVEWAIEDWGEPENIVEMPSWVGAFGSITSVACALVQCFYAWRVWAMSQHRNYLLVAFIALGGLAAGGLGLALSAHYLHSDWLRDFFQQWPAILAHFVITAVIDVGITGGVIYYLVVRPRKEGGGLIATNFRFRRIARQTVQSNAAALITQATLMGLILGRRSGAEWTIVALLQTKVYLASLIATLLSRPSPHGSTTTAGGGTATSFIGGPPSSLGLPMYCCPTNATATATGAASRPQSTRGPSPYLSPVALPDLRHVPDGEEQRRPRSPGGGERPRRDAGLKNGRGADGGGAGGRKGEVRILIQRADGREVEMREVTVGGDESEKEEEGEDGEEREGEGETALSVERRERARGGRESPAGLGLLLSGEGGRVRGKEEEGED
ncbi:hypothetical protein JCM6882_004334 [Rhodosporidiobolus microsporus]